VTAPSRPCTASPGVALERGQGGPAPCARGHGVPVARPPPGARSRPRRGPLPRPGAASVTRPRCPCVAWPLPAARSRRVCDSFTAHQRGLVRARARVVHAVPWRGSSCPRRVASCLVRDVPVYPLCIFCALIMLFILMKWNSTQKLITLVISCS
jgi:hypothetical protein